MTSPPRLDPDRLERARRLRVFHRVLSLSERLLALAFLLLLHAWGFAPWLGDALGGTPGFWRDYGVIAGVLIATGLLGLPFELLTWRRGRAEGLVVQSLPGWLGDQAKGLVLTLILLGGPLALWYQVLAREDWWLLTILGVALVSAVIFGASPLLQGLFFRFERLADPDLEARITALGAKAGVRVAGVYRWGLSAKSTASNAAVTGLGPTKRIIIADTMLDRYPPEEIEAVLAHELAHQVHGDLYRFLALGSAGGAALLIGLRVALDALLGPGAGASVANYPLLAVGLSLAAFLAGPLFMTFSRWREYAADAYAARQTSAAAIGGALVRLVDQNLGDPEPPAWEEALFMSHPSVANRVRALGLPWPPATGAS